jgi:hypothetical protein
MGVGKGFTGRCSRLGDERAAIGVENDTDLLTAALAIAAGDDEFGEWLVTRGARLPVDFELEF